MSVDLSKLHRGAIVTFQGVCVCDGADNENEVEVASIRGTRNGTPVGGFIWSGAIIDIQPRPIQAGDRVRVKGAESEGEIVATDGPDAWVKWDEEDRNTYPLADLERIEEGA